MTGPILVVGGSALTASQFCVIQSGLEWQSLYHQRERDPALPPQLKAARRRLDAAVISATSSLRPALSVGFGHSGAQELPREPVAQSAVEIVFHVSTLMVTCSQNRQ